MGSERVIRGYKCQWLCLWQFKEDIIAVCCLPAQNHPPPWKRIHRLAWRERRQRLHLLTILLHCLSGHHYFLRILTLRAEWNSGREAHLPWMRAAWGALERRAMSEPNPGGFSVKDMLQLCNLA